MPGGLKEQILKKIQEKPKVESQNIYFKLGCILI